MSDQLTQFEAIEGNDYWIRMVKCQHACPVHTNACGYVTAIAEGRYEDAYRVARATNPFASICGRVCGARAKPIAGEGTSMNRWPYARSSVS